MSMWLPSIGQVRGPKYRAIATAIRSAVTSGELQPNEKLLPHREMAWRLGVTIATVAQAYKLAQKWGLLEARVGHGTRVVDPAKVRGPITLEDAKAQIDLGLLIPTPIDEGSLQSKAFDDAFESLGNTFLVDSLSAYGPELGYLKHREVGAEWLSGYGLPTDPGNVVITHGAQEAFLVIANMLTNAGDAVLVEEHAYIGFINLCRKLNLNMRCIPLDDQGMIDSALDAELRKSGAKVVFLCPTLQNPTGVTMLEERRAAIADTLKRRDAFAIETDPLSKIQDAVLPPIASFAPERTFFVASLSKYVSPTLRVAFMVPPRRWLEEVKNVKHALTISGSSLQAEIATRWIRSGVMEQLCAWQKNEIAARSLLARDILGAVFPENQAVRPFLWLALPSSIRSGAFERMARQRGVACIGSGNFNASRSGSNDAVRLSLTTPRSRQLLEQGLSVVHSLLNSGTR